MAHATRVAMTTTLGISFFHTFENNFIGLGFWGMRTEFVGLWFGVGLPVPVR